MTAGNLPILRGRLAHVFSDCDRSIATLSRQMDMIGIRYRINPAQRDPEVGMQWVDMDTLMSLEINKPEQAPGLALQTPIIAIVGTQSPSCIERVLAFDPCMVIAKPVPNQCVFMAMSVALHEARRRDMDMMRMLTLEGQLRAQPLVIAAVNCLMTRQGVDEGAALTWLRDTARDRMIPVEALAAELVRPAQRNRRRA